MVIFQVDVGWVSWYQNVSILDFIGVKDDGGGGDNWSYNRYKAPIESSPPTNQHPAVYFLSPNGSVTALKGR